MGLLLKIEAVIFEIVAIILIFIIGLLVTIYATQAHNQCKLAIKGEYTDVPDSDIPIYESARHNLQQIVWIGWTIVTLSIFFLIVFIIIVIFFLPGETAVEGGVLAEEAVASEATTVFSQIQNMVSRKVMSKFKDELLELVQKQNELERKEKSGLYFHVLFGGWIMTSIFFVMLITVFLLGIFAAMASVKLGNTEGKHGQGKAQVAAIIGIIPFSIFIVWLIADFIYKWYISNKINTIKTEQRDTKRKLTEDIEEKEKEKEKEKIAAKNVSVSQNNTPIKSQSLTDEILNVGKSKAVDYLNSEEGRQGLSNALSKGASLISSSLSKV